MGGAGAADPANTRSLNYGANENKAIGANVFNSNNTNETPAFIRITAIRGKNAGSSHGLMTLENGEEIVVGQVISRADFERIFWNASKSDGSFSFVPVQDAQGTTAPNTVEQTVVIKTPDPLAPGSNPGTSSGEGGNTGHEASSQTGAGSGTGSSTGNGANTGANAGTGTANNGTDPNNTTGQQSGNDKGDGTAQNTGSPSGAGETSNQSASSGDGTTPAGGKPGAEGSGSENKPVTGSGNDSTSGSASDSGSAGGSDSTSGSDRNKGSGSDKGGSTPSEGQSSQASNGQAPSQNAGGQGSESQTAPQTPSGQGGSEQTTAPTQGSQSGGQPPAQNTSGQGDVSQTPPQNAGGGSDTGNPATGNPSTGDTTQTGGSQTGGAQTGGSQTGTGETGSDGNHGNGDHGDGNQTSDDGQASHDGENDSAKDDGKHDGADSKGDGTKGEDTKGEDGEQSKNGDDSASPTNPPTTTSPPTPPDYAPNQSVQQAIHANNKPVGASIFNGTNPAHAPSFVKITAVLDKDGKEVPDAMTLGKEGEAITTDQVISKEQFDNVFLDALKAPGGSFKFIPVMDSEGTEMPGATEQTVSIGFDYVYHFSKQPFLDAVEGEGRFSHYKVHLLTEHQDTNNTLDGMFKLDGDQRTPLKVGDLIRPEDFDKLYWDYTSNNGGRFELAGLDSQGHEISNEEHLQLYMADYAKTRTGKVPPEEPGGEETDVEDSEDSNDIAGHSAALHPESFTDAASAFHGSSHLSVNGQSTLDNLLEHQVSHGIL